MTYIAKVTFKGVIGGAEMTFAEGATISAADAAEMGLAGKPDLAEPAKAKKGAADANS
jgi:hypothetical protein